MFFIRPIARDDLPAVLALSERTGSGLTTLPANRERLRERIERSLASFAGAADKADACYMFVLVEARDAGDERVVGISAIEAAVGLREPWYNYHVGTLVHASRALDVYTVDADAVPVERPHRPHRALLAVPRPALPASARTARCSRSAGCCSSPNSPSSSPAKVIAELRGRLEADGTSPFWEGLGRHFFAMEYSRADYLTGIGQKSFIAELMPKHPVYVNLLPQSAREAIGAVHADTAPARAMLEQEGFRYEGYVDIFDAGPDGRMRARQHRRGAPRVGDDVHARRRGPGAGQPDRRHPVARLQPQVRRSSARSSPRRRRASTAFRCCRTPPRRSASREGDSVRAACRSRRRDR